MIVQFLIGLIGKLFQAVATAFDNARDDRAHHDLGASEQAAADAETARLAKAKADAEVSKPTDIATTIKDLENGEF